MSSVLDKVAAGHLSRFLSRVGFNYENIVHSGRISVVKHIGVIENVNYLSYIKYDPLTTTVMYTLAEDEGISLNYILDEHVIQLGEQFLKEDYAYVVYCIAKIL